MREYIVFVSRDHYNPVGIVRTLGEEGIRPVRHTMLIILKKV